MQVKTRAIVLHTFKYGETQMITEMLTAECGRISCITRLPSRRGGKIKKQYFQTLSILDVVLDINKRSNLHRISEASPVYAFTSIPFNPVKMSITMFVAEFIRNAARMEQSDAPTFDYIANSIMWLDGCEGHFANFHLVFMMRMSIFLGFYPNLEDYRNGDWFDMRTGCFCGSMPLHHDRLNPDEAARMGTLLRMSFATMHLFKMSRDERNRMVELIMKYYRAHIPGFPDLRSHDILKELF